MTLMPWKGELYVPETNLGEIPSLTHGFFISRPLYCHGDAPVWRFVKLAKVLIQTWLRQSEPHICMYSKLDTEGSICGFLIVHVDDLLYTGATEFMPSVKKAAS